MRGLLTLALLLGAPSLATADLPARCPPPPVPTPTAEQLRSTVRGARPAVLRCVEQLADRGRPVALRVQAALGPRGAEVRVTGGGERLVACARQAVHGVVVGRWGRTKPRQTIVAHASFQVPGLAVRPAPYDAGAVHRALSARRFALLSCLPDGGRMPGTLALSVAVDGRGQAHLEHASLPSGVSRAVVPCLARQVQSVRVAAPAGRMQTTHRVALGR